MSQAVELNLGIAHSIASRFRGRGVEDGRFAQPGGKQANGTAVRHLQGVRPRGAAASGDAARIAAGAASDTRFCLSPLGPASGVPGLHGRGELLGRRRGGPSAVCKSVEPAAMSFVPVHLAPSAALVVPKIG